MASLLGTLDASKRGMPLASILVSRRRKQHVVVFVRSCPPFLRSGLRFFVYINEKTKRLDGVF